MDTYVEAGTAVLKPVVHHLAARHWFQGPLASDPRVVASTCLRTLKVGGSLLRPQVVAVHT